nr:immunoglobulin heavy chain junction region [Macaca mulatta]MOX58795.1 immunoglobulin heavy chain junction region [Macaca mulatta]MOX58975.1 immunoglobulin heavy chain junction region [Macaca mulatta]MOX59134.1 immunoglobulin heavy chain junction region [Macaca mulatta]MOX59143.1 immunoglobulin heavy chain junction region [Macaca mulatta]
CARDDIGTGFDYW